VSRVAVPEERAVRIGIYQGDVLDALSGVRGCEAVVSDPPAGVKFMGRKFDTDHGGADKWVEYMAPRFAAMRECCIPGAYGLFWALPRTQDWTMAALRRAGWKVVDVLAHFFAQGMPKSKGLVKPAQEAWILCRDPRGKVRPLNLDACRVRRSWKDDRPESWFRSGHTAKPEALKIAGAPPGNGIRTDERGSLPTNLLLSHAPACRCVGLRQLRANGSIAEGSKGAGPRGNVVLGEDDRDRGQWAAYGKGGTEESPAWECLAQCECGLASLSRAGGDPEPCECGGERWWVCPVAELDAQSGYLRGRGNVSSTRRTGRKGIVYAPDAASENDEEHWHDKNGGGASRFFPSFHYDAKAPTKERQAGCEHLLWVEDRDAPIGWRRASREEYDAAAEDARTVGNAHSTIKPVGLSKKERDGLMRWLVRLATPEGGPVVDGFCGSGSTLLGAMVEGRDSYGCDVDAGAVEIAEARVAHWSGALNLRVSRA
jgi:site-specific DNA-methyltransferase (adenine-specific)